MTRARLALAIAVVAGLAGFAGVALAALAAHKVQVPPLASAAQMLMVHAAAGLALIALAQRGQRACYWLAASALVVFGSVLFATAVALPILTSTGLLKGLAPIGGSTVMIGWLVAAVAAARSRFDS